MRPSGLKGCSRLCRPPCFRSGARDNAFELGDYVDQGALVALPSRSIARDRCANPANILNSPSGLIIRQDPHHQRAAAEPTFDDDA